jgi:hypothetical protein
VGEFVLELFMLIVSVFLFVETGEIRSVGMQSTRGASLWPRIILLIIIISTIVLLARLILRKAITWKGFRTATTLDESHRKAFMIVSAVMAVTILYASFMNLIGFLIISLVSQVLILFILGTRRWVTLIATPLWITASLYVLFIRIIHIPLSRGAGLFYEVSRIFY